MISLFLLALVTGALSLESFDTTSTCESYDTKYADVDWDSSYTVANDPCFGYTTSCCEDTSITKGCCYWKQTAYCLNTYGRSNCTLDDGADCPACCDSTDTASEEAICTPTSAPTSDPVVEATPSPTMHSAKKWERLHPDYQGGDGELLWNIYYGEYAEDKRFNAFRADQLWDAAVVRPMIEMELNEIKAFETTSTCESYDTKYADVDWDSSYTVANDPCFGYTTSCCEDTSITKGCCYWKQTAYCLNTYGRSNCTLDDGADCPACCDSTDTASEEAICTPTSAPTADPVVEATPSPTMHSAKKWERLHPDYTGGDGELLWNIYYGDFAADKRFNAFRADQLWDAAIVRQMVGEELTEMEETTTSSSCESYDEKYAEVDWTSNATSDDPCFGYTTSCCEDTSITQGCCYWKQTAYCLNSYGRSTCDEDDGSGCPACCDSTADAAEDAACTPTQEPTMDPVTAPTEPDTTEAAEATPSPTMHSAKKWEMLHPDYQGGDGELLWNIYYGEYAVDDRFDAFRNAQLWNADVIRPIIEGDVKYQRFQLAHESLNASGQQNAFRLADYQWLLLAAAVMVVLAAYAAWYKRAGSYTKIVDTEEADGLLAGYGASRN